jgi:hypothetical protein
LRRSERPANVRGQLGRRPSAASPLPLGGAPLAQPCALGCHPVRSICWGVSFAPSGCGRVVFVLPVPSSTGSEFSAEDTGVSLEDIAAPPCSLAASVLRSGAFAMSRERRSPQPVPRAENGKGAVIGRPIRFLAQPTLKACMGGWHFSFSSAEIKHART